MLRSFFRHISLLSFDVFSVCQHALYIDVWFLLFDPKRTNHHAVSLIRDDNSFAWGEKVEGLLWNSELFALVDVEAEECVSVSRGM